MKVQIFHFAQRLTGLQNRMIIIRVIPLHSKTNPSMINFESCILQPYLKLMTPLRPGPVVSGTGS